jgi:hypothetical protein
MDDMEERKILPLPGLEPGPLGRPAYNNIFCCNMCITDITVSTRTLDKNLIRLPRIEMWDTQEGGEARCAHIASLFSRFITLLVDIKIPILPNQYTYHNSLTESDDKFRKQIKTCN